MDKNRLEAAVKNNHNRIKEAVSQQEAVITTNKNENRGRRRIYKTDDAVKNINGYIYIRFSLFNKLGIWISYRSNIC